MEVIFLGTGTSQGVPPLKFDPSRLPLDLNNPRNWRTRSSIHVILDGCHIQVDAGPEFRLQCLWNEINHIDLFILTHEHADHIMGMDDLRAFCQEGALPVYSTPSALQCVKSIFHYAILDKPVVSGYPAFALKECPAIIETPGGIIKTFLLPHGEVQTLGLVFEEKSTQKRFAYFSDCKTLTNAAKNEAQGIDVLAIDALRRNPHPSHLTLDEALHHIAELQPKQSFLTHTTALFDYDTLQSELPEGVKMAYDGLRLKL